MTMKPKAICQNCDWEGDPSKTKPVKDLEERVAPGEILPVGECPRCGAVCHLKKTYVFEGPDGKRKSVDALSEDDAASMILSNLGWNPVGTS